MKKLLVSAITVSYIIASQAQGIASTPETCGQLSNSFTQLSESVQLASNSYSSSNAALSCKEISTDLEMVYVDKLLVAQAKIKKIKKEANSILYLVQKNLKSEFSPKTAKELNQLKKDLKKNHNIQCHEVEVNPASFTPQTTNFIGDEVGFRLQCVDKNRLLFRFDWFRLEDFKNVHGGTVSLQINDEIINSGDERFSVYLSIEKDINGRYKLSFSSADLSNLVEASLGVISKTGDKSWRYNHAHVGEGIARFNETLDFSSQYNKGFEDFISAYYPDCSGHLELDRKLDSFNDLKSLRKDLEKNNRVQRQ